jgi:hypothetical protein
MEDQILQVCFAYCVMKYGSIGLQQYVNWYNKQTVKPVYSEIEKWMKSFDSSIHAENEETFKFACINGHLNIANWILLDDSNN